MELHHIVLAGVAPPVNSAWLARKRGPLMLLCALLLAAVLAGLGIGKHPFWDDEAETALIARNIVAGHGRSGWTGDNVIAFMGGANLDSHLQESDVPPLQYYVTAASFRVFGVSDITARLPFLLIGLASLWLLYRWSAVYLGDGPLCWLPPLILATRLSFLLYLPQCRYYALTAFFACAALWAWSVCERRPVAACVGGALAMLGMFESNYLDAAALSVAMGTISLWGLTRRRMLFFLAIGAIQMAALALLFASHPLIDLWQARHIASPWIQRFPVLIWWHLLGLDYFQFIPTLPLLALPLAWLHPKAREFQPVARKAAAMLGLALIYIIVIAAISPQDITVTDTAYMRYDIPLLVAGSLPTAVAILIIAALGRVWLTALLAPAIMLTSLPYLLRVNTVGLVPLYDRFQELRDPHPSGTDSWLMAARILPPGSTLRAYTRNMVLPLMFYYPNLHYYNVIDRDKILSPATKAILPHWVFCCADSPEYIITGIGDYDRRTSPLDNPPGYRLIKTIPWSWNDHTRPELPQRLFHPILPDDRSNGLAILRREAGHADQ